MKMNFKKVFVLAAFAVLGFSQNAHALTFSDLINFPGGKTVNEILFNYQSDSSWTHDINDNLGGENINNVTITDATLTLNFRRTNGANINLIFTSIFDPESWGLQGLGLLNSVGNTAANQNFIFDPSALANLQADGLFSVVPEEFTLDIQDLIQKDSFQVFSSKLTGNYTIKDPVGAASAVPEPVSGLLIATGLGLAGILRRRSA